MSQMSREQTTIWTEFKTPDASTDRGWFKAITEPYDYSRWMEYNHNHNTMPVYDEDIGCWREQSTLGNYLDYEPCRIGQSSPDGFVHAICYASNTSRYCLTVADAKRWIESEAKRVRPALQIQPALFA